MLTAFAEDPIDGLAPDVETPGPVGAAPVVAREIPVLQVSVPALAALPPMRRRTTAGWIAASLLIHAAALATFMGRDVPPIASGSEEIPVEIVMEPIEVVSAAAPSPEVQAKAKEPPPQPDPAAAEPVPPTMDAPAVVAEAEQPPVPAAETPPVPAEPEPVVEAAPMASSEPPVPEPEAAPAPVPSPSPAPTPTDAVQTPAVIALVAPRPVPPQKLRPAPTVAARPVAKPAAPAHREATSPVRSTQLARAAPVVSPPPARPEVSGADIAAWRNALFGRLRSAMRYPDAARARGATGQTSVSFSLDAGGHVSRSSVVRSSGHADLDAEATAIVRRASPFPPPPPGAPRSLTVPVNFSLR